MIVVEDIDANEIHRFLVVDSSIRLGIVRAGASLRTFDPDRALAYHSMVENQIHDFSTKYSGAFKFIPRRAYDYLKEPELLSDLHSGVTDVSCSSWLADLFVAAPLVHLGGSHLPEGQKDANAQSVYRWSNFPPHSTRFYNLQDMRLGRRTPTGWGALLAAADLKDSLHGPNRNDLLTHLKAKRPVFIELDAREDIEPLLAWIVLLKEAGLGIPKLALSVREHKSWSKEITRLMEIPSSKVLTSGATISSLASLVRTANSEDGKGSWSRRLMFSSSYPETHLGDSVSEVISYFLSRNIGAEPSQVQRVLGGNMLSLLPPRPPHLTYTENTSSVMAEENLGRSAMNELVRILQILRARKVLTANSVDFMVEDDGGSVFLDGAILTAMDPATERATSISILVDRNGSVMVSGWRKAFTDTLIERDALLLQTLARANARLDGPIFGSPAHLTRFDEELLRCLQVKSPREIMSALHFGVEVAKTDPGVYLMCPEDMEALEVESGQYVLALDTRTGQWFPAVAKAHSRCNERSVVVSESDAQVFGLKNSSVVNVVRFDGEIADLTSLVLACSSSSLGSGQELYSYLQLHGEEMRSLIDGRLVSVDSSLFVDRKGRRVTLRVAGTTPRLEAGHVGRASSSDVKFRPVQSFSDINVLLCLSSAKDMLSRDVTLETLNAAKRELADFSTGLPELQSFIESLSKTSSRAEISALATLLAFNLFNHNQSDGRFGVVTFGEEVDKFSIQHGDQIQTYIEFSKDIQSQEVAAALTYSILDNLRNPSGRENMALAYRAAAEYLEDFGSDRPTLVIMFSNGIGNYDEDHLPFLEALAKHERCRLELFMMGAEPKTRQAMRLLKGINADVISTRRFSSLKFVGHLLDAIESLVPTSRARSES